MMCCRPLKKQKAFLPVSRWTLSAISSVRTRRATERNLEIMGEAVGRIPKLDPALALANARQIVATRHRIIHGYDTVSDELIWSIVVRHLPQLKREVTALLAQE